jgi:hypothetical protein
MFAFQGLDTGQFIIADDPFALASQFSRLMIQLIHIGILGLKLIIIFAGQPVADQMGFEIGLFLKDVRRVGPKSV